jgi:DNA-binding NarL/FixJ family response regulator
MSGEIARLVVESFREPAASEAEAKTLSRREVEILDLLCQGLLNKEIADRLSLGLETIRTHLKRIYDKLHVHCRTEAALKYRETRDHPSASAP